MTTPIDWTKPVRFVPDCSLVGDPSSLQVLSHHNGRAFVTWGTKELAHLVLPDGTFQDCEVRLENVPEEPKNCVVLIRSNAAGKWFVPHIYTGGYLEPMTRTEAEQHACGYSVTRIVELPA